MFNHFNFSPAATDKSNLSRFLALTSTGNINQLVSKQTSTWAWALINLTDNQASNHAISFFPAISFQHLCAKTRLHVLQRRATAKQRGKSQALVGAIPFCGEYPSPCISISQSNGWNFKSWWR